MHEHGKMYEPNVFNQSCDNRALSILVLLHAQLPFIHSYSWIHGPCLGEQFQEHGYRGAMGQKVGKYDYSWKRVINEYRTCSARSGHDRSDIIIMSDRRRIYDTGLITAKIVQLNLYYWYSTPAYWRIWRFVQNLSDV